MNKKKKENIKDWLWKIDCGYGEHLLVKKITTDQKYALTCYEDNHDGSRYMYRRSTIHYNNIDECYYIHRDGKLFDITPAFYYM